MRNLVSLGGKRSLASTDEVDFNARATRQRGHSNTSAGRQSAFLEVGPVDRIHLREVIVEVRQENACGDDVVEACVDSFEQRAKAFHHALRLRFDALGERRVVVLLR